MIFSDFVDRIKCQQVLHTARYICLCNGQNCLLMALVGLRWLSNELRWNILFTYAQEFDMGKQEVVERISHHRSICKCSYVKNVLCKVCVYVFMIYSASHSRVAPENVGLQKEQKCNTFAFIPVMKCGCVFWEFAKRKLVTWKDKTK
jgi:hypothetical protein